MDLTTLILYIDDSNCKNKESALESLSFFTIVDTVPDSKFFYPIFLSTGNELTHIIPDSILESIVYGNCLLLVIHYHEARSWQTYDSLIHVIQSHYTISDDKFVFVTGNVIGSSKYKSVLCNSWEPASFSNNVVKEKQLGTHSIIKSEPRLYKFISLNRICRPHRFALASGLYLNKDRGLLSFANAGYGSQDQQHFKNQFSLQYPAYANQWEQLNLDNEIPLVLPPNLDPDGLSIDTAILDTNTDKFYQSYLHIVSETSVDYVFFTEKTYKPIKYFQPFVMINGQFSLQYLKEMGYKTFSDYIDESYDVENDPNRRLTLAIESSLEFIERDDLHDVMKKMYPIFEHNHNTFISRCKNFQSTLHYDISKILHAQDQQ